MGEGWLSNTTFIRISWALLTRGCDFSEYCSSVVRPLGSSGNMAQKYPYGGVGNARLGRCSIFVNFSGRGDAGNRAGESTGVACDEHGPPKDCYRCTATGCCRTEYL